MINKRLLLLLLPLLMAAPPAPAQQELQLSQYMFNGLTLNPALAGSYEALNAQLMYRRQWVGVTNAPLSYTGSVDGMVTQSNSMGWGLSMVMEQMGLMETLGAYASYAYRIRLNSMGDRLSLGLSGGAMQQNFGGINANLRDNQGNPVYHEGDGTLSPEARWRPDFRVGAYYSMGRMFYAGVSASNIGSLMSDSALHNPFVYINLGGNFYAGDRWKLSPSTLVTCPLDDRYSLDLNMAVTFVERVWVGVGVRTALPLGAGTYTPPMQPGSIAIMAEGWITQALRIGYCYDYGVGRLAGVQKGSHEVSLGYTLARKITKVKSAREVGGFSY